MTNVDSVYNELLRDILDNGVEKQTRSGAVKSVFGRQLRFDLKEGFPLLTTKKIPINGAIHELLWFLNKYENQHGSMNIEYLVRNNVHIWDDDAYRWFRSNVVPEYNGDGNIRDILVCLDDDYGRRGAKRPMFEYWIERDYRLKEGNWLESITKEDFIDLVVQRVELIGRFGSRYRFGDIGPVYGKQWRNFGHSGTDQIVRIIETLKTNPDDRRMLCVAYNVDDTEWMALPPCHTMFQFYTRELTETERVEISGGGSLDNVPTRALSCMWSQRSVDVPLGLCWNIASYSLLTHMVAKLVNMVPDEVIGSLGDCHIYLNQISGVTEQLSRNGYDSLPRLSIRGEQKVIEDFKHEDFELTGYECDPFIRFPLSVGK